MITGKYNVVINKDAVRVLGWSFGAPLKIIHRSETGAVLHCKGRMAWNGSHNEYNNPFYALVEIDETETKMTVTESCEVTRSTVNQVKKDYIQRCGSSIAVEEPL